MKHKNRIEKLKNRIKDFESDPVIKTANSQSPGTYTKPGSQSK